MWLHITEIERHVQFMKSVLGTLQNFYMQNILPEVLTRKTKNSAPKIFDGLKDELYCFWNGPYSSDETCIGYGSGKYRGELSCVNMKQVPRNNWYCPVCRKEKQKVAVMQKIRKGKRRYLWQYRSFYLIKVFMQMFTTLWMKYFGNKSAFIFHNSYFSTCIV